MKEVIKYMATQLSRVAMVTAILAVAMVPALGANAASDKMRIFGHGHLHQIVVQGNQAVATFEIPKGANNNCEKRLPYSLVVYTAPDSTLRPLSSQKLFSSNIKHLSTGTHTMRAPLPACGFFQVDLVKGLPITNLNDSGNSYGPQGRLIDAIGGGSACPAPAPQPQPQPQPPAPQPPAPAQPAVTNNNVNTNVNTQQQTQTVTVNPAAPAPQPQPQPVEVTAAPAQGKTTTLPNTGPGSAAAVFVAVSALGGLAYNLILRRRVVA